VLRLLSEPVLDPILAALLQKQAATGALRIRSFLDGRTMTEAGDGTLAGTVPSSNRPTIALPAATAAPVWGSASATASSSGWAGRITLESKPGAGSTFEVSIPLAAAEGGQKSFAAPDLAGQSIMLVSPQGNRGFADRAAGCSAGAPRPAWCRMEPSRRRCLPERALARNPDRPCAGNGRYRSVGPRPHGFMPPSES